MDRVEFYVDVGHYGLLLCGYEEEGSGGSVLFHLGLEGNVT